MGWQIACPSGWRSRGYKNRADAVAQLERMAATYQRQEEQHLKPDCPDWRSHDVVEVT